MEETPGEIVMEPRREAPGGGHYGVHAFGLSADEAIAAREIVRPIADKMLEARTTPEADDRIGKLNLELKTEFERRFGGVWIPSAVIAYVGGGAHTAIAVPANRALHYSIPGVGIDVCCIFAPTVSPIAPKDKIEEEIKVAAKKEAFAQCKDATRSKGNKMKRANGLRCFCRRLALSRKTLKFAGKN